MPGQPTLCHNLYATASIINTSNALASALVIMLSPVARLVQVTGPQITKHILLLVCVLAHLQVNELKADHAKVSTKNQVT